VKRKRKLVFDQIEEVRSEAPANYYPINSLIFLDNHDNENPMMMAVMNDRPMGGTGFRKGCIELMFNRRGST
jgi:Glycosyl hydrolases family 38 C-terminal domain